MKNIFKFNRVFSVLLLSSLFVANVAAWEFPWTPVPVVPTKIERVGAAWGSTKAAGGTGLTFCADSAKLLTNFVYSPIATFDAVAENKGKAALAVAGVALTGYLVYKGGKALYNWYKKPVVKGSEVETTVLAPVAATVESTTKPNMISRAFISTGASLSKAASYVTPLSADQKLIKYIQTNDYAAIIALLEAKTILSTTSYRTLCRTYITRGGVSANTDENLTKILAGVRAKQATAATTVVIAQ